MNTTVDLIGFTVIVTPGGTFLREEEFLRTVAVMTLAAERQSGKFERGTATQQRIRAEVAQHVLRLMSGVNLN